MSVYDKLKELNITLPPVAVPAAAYVPFVQTGNLVFISGHIARREGTNPPPMSNGYGAPGNTMPMETNACSRSLPPMVTVGA